MSDDPYREHRDVAERAAAEAGRVLLEHFGAVTAREKAPGDLVTDADLASQRTIAAILAGAFPDHTLLAEEEGVTPAARNPWRWIVDPLDGTTNFAHGNPLWCVSIALEHAGELVVGVVHAPLLGAVHAASRGRGATLNGRPARVSRVDSLANALIATGMPTDFEADADRQMALMRRFSTGTHSVRRTGTTAWNLALVASGGFDLYYATSVHPWDVAAGVLLVREAGGAVTGLAGEPYRVDRPTLLASNGLLHPEGCRAVAEAWPISSGRGR